MPGITGIIGSHVLVPASVADVDAMASRLHDGIADSHFGGTLRDERLRAHVTWTKRDYEPERIAWNDARDICLVFIGDDFDIDAKISKPRQRGYGPKTDAACLVRQYEELGPEFVIELNGRFTGIVFDLRQEKVILFNDRYGANRVYLHEAPNGLFFSSKAKSLLAILPKLRQIDQRGLAEFFSVGCVLQNRSLFTDVFLLPPGSLWTFGPDGKISRKCYFDPGVWERQEALSPADYSAQLAAVFGSVAPKYLRGSAKVAMSLTGGLDSRMILAWSRAAPGALPCYTFGGPYRDCADVRIARRLAEISRQPHATLRIGPDFFRDFPALAGKAVSATDGAMDVSGAVELYVNQLARQFGPIRLTGNYGSEILRSNVAFRPARLDMTLFTPEFRQLIKQAADTYRTEATGHRLSFIAFKQVPWHHYARFAAEQSQLTPRSPFLDNELVALAYRAPRELAGGAAPLLKLIADGCPALDSIGTDRALRAHSTPLVSQLSHWWQEFTAKAEYAYDYGMPQWLARTDRWLKPMHLEKLFLGRHKFYHFRIWYRDQLSVHLRSGAMAGSNTPACYREDAAKRLIGEHTSGRENRTSELHKLLTVQLIEDLFTTPSRSN